MKKLDLARIAQLLVLNYPVSESCRELGIPEIDFWTEMVSSVEVSNGISIAYSMGRDFYAIDNRLPLAAAERSYTRGSEEALKSFRQQLADTNELKSDLIQRILDEAENDKAGSNVPEA